MNFTQIAQGLRMIADAIETQGTVEVPTTSPAPLNPPMGGVPVPQQAQEAPQNVVLHPTVEIQLPDVLAALRQVAQRMGQEKVLDWMKSKNISQWSQATQDQLRETISWAQEVVR